MGRRGFELDGNFDPFVQAQFPDGTLRHECRQGEAAVNKDADMQSDRVHARDGAVEAVGGKRRAGGR